MEFTAVEKDGNVSAWIAKITTELGQNIQIRISRQPYPADPEAWFLSCLDIGIKDYRLDNELGLSAGNSRLALRYCAVIAHDRADALTRAYLVQG